MSNESLSHILFAGQQVELTGTLEGDTITAKTVQPVTK